MNLKECATLDLALQAVNLRIAETLVKQWTCRHCGHQTPIIAEVCDGCGIMDDMQGEGEELPGNRADRERGVRYSTGMWTPDVIGGIVGGLL